MKKYVPKEKEEIDWGNPQWVVSNSRSDLFILTTGEHTNNSFNGTALPCEYHPMGKHDIGWIKSAFTPVTGTIMFPISNED